MVSAGSFIELRGRVMPPTIEFDTHGRASVSREGFNAQVVILDCKTTSFTNFTNGGLRRSIRRHTELSCDDSQAEGIGDVEEKEREREEDVPLRDYGNVLCLLLYTGTCLGISQACVLILGQVNNAGPDCYERLGLGSGVLESWLGPLYKGRSTWALWRGWENLEQWQDWETWFADAEVKTVRIV